MKDESELLLSSEDIARLKNIPIHTQRCWLPHTQGTVVSCKLWQLLPCNFRFFLNGKIMLGPGRPFWIYFICLFSGVLASFIILDVLPFCEKWGDVHSTLGVIVVVLIFTSLYCLFRITLRDPGLVLPHWFSNQSSIQSKVSRHQELNEAHGYVSYCSICKIFQLPDTYHCAVCNACIDGADHHCTLLGTCIGKRTYPAFFVFIAATGLSVWLGMITSFTHLIQNWIWYGAGHAFGHAVTLYLILSSLAIPPLGLYGMVVLPLFHLKLIYKGTTLFQKDDHYFARSEGQRHRYWTLKEKLSFFLQNFYTRVIKTTPPSQIPNSVLQTLVSVPAFPRIPWINLELKRGQCTCHARLRFLCVSWSLTKEKINFDIEKFHSYRVPILNIIKDQGNKTLLSHSSTPGPGKTSPTVVTSHRDLKHSAVYTYLSKSVSRLSQKIHFLPPLKIAGLNNIQVKDANNNENETNDKEIITV